MLSLSPGRVIAGKYCLDKELARGGMGSLWIGFDRRLRRKVAIKFINSMAAELEEARVRFEREARAAAQIRSPHVVQTYDFGMDRGHAYIVMELLEGEDLSTRLSREKRLKVGTVSKVLGQIAKGLDAVHAAGIVHRDLKPANVFLAQVADEETIKLIDFGVARSEEVDGRRTTGRGALVGTVKYMSPEQARGDVALDYRTDLWALAVIVYRLLTGRHPFHGATMEELLLAISRDPIAPPSTFISNLPAGIDTFFERAFMREPGKRFHSAQQMASAFSAAINVVRSGTLPWGAQPTTETKYKAAQVLQAAQALQAEQLIEEEQRQARPVEEERKTRPEVRSARVSFEPRDSLEATLQFPNALPPTRGVLPSDYTPMRRSLSGTYSDHRWWWASVPAALVVVAAVVVGITVRSTRTSIINSRSNHSSQQSAAPLSR